MTFSALVVGSVHAAWPAARAASLPPVPTAAVREAGYSRAGAAAGRCAELNSSRFKDVLCWSDDALRVAVEKLFLMRVIGTCRLTPERPKCTISGEFPFTKYSGAYQADFNARQVTDDSTMCLSSDCKSYHQVFGFPKERLAPLGA